MKLKQIATIKAGYPFRGKIPEVPGSAVVAVQIKDDFQIKQERTSLHKKPVKVLALAI